MLMQRQGRQRVILAMQPEGRGVADVVNHLDGGAGVLEAEAAAIEDVLVAEGMQLGEALAELESLVADGDGAVGAAAFGFDGLGQGVGVDAEEPAHAGALELEVARGAVVGVEVYDVAAQGAEDPLQHVEEVDADVGGYAAGFAHFALPTGIVPIAAGGDVG